MKCVDANHSCIQIRIRLQKTSKQLRGDIAAARNRDMRVPRDEALALTQRVGERGFMHALVDLEQMWVRLADTDPNDFRSAFCRERSDADDGQKECAETLIVPSFSRSASSTSSATSPKKASVRCI